MKPPLLALAIGSLTLSVGAFARDKARDPNEHAVVREIDVTALRTQFATPGGYARLLITAEVLPRVVPDEEDRKRLKKAVDFSKQQLVVFAWLSGGDDKLTYSGGKGGTLIVFRYDAGGEKKEPATEKKIRKSKLRAFAIPRDAAWAVSGWPFVDPHSIPKRSSPR